MYPYIAERRDVFGCTYLTTNRFPEAQEMSHLSPPLDLLSALVVVGLGGLYQLGDGGSVVGLNIGDGNAGGSLAFAHSPQPAK